MTVNSEGTSRKSLIRTGKVELLEFFAQRRACDDQDRGMACSVARALVRGARNALLTVTPLWLARSLGGWQGESSPQLKTRRARERPSRRIRSEQVRIRPRRHHEARSESGSLSQWPSHPWTSPTLYSPVSLPTAVVSDCPSIVRRE